MDHGLYTNYTADMDIVEGVVYRTFGNSIVPINEDLSLNSARAIGNISGIYSHSVSNNNILIGSSDFVAPDLVSILSLDGQELASFNVGALPSQMVYYSPDIVSTDEVIGAPSSFSLGNNYPNPFNPSTSIPFSLQSSGDVRLSIFDINGRIVATLIESHLTAGNYISNWDGTNRQGKAVSSGIYYAILHSNSPNIYASIRVSNPLVRNESEGRLVRLRWDGGPSGLPAPSTDHDSLMKDLSKSIHVGRKCFQQMYVGMPSM
jgi:hypothetical protein